MVLGADPHPRKSWVVWAEQGKYPNVIIKILSESTAETDRNFKKQLYQDTFRTPEYFWFDPETLELQGFCLLRGLYAVIEPNPQGQLLSQQLGVYLGIHEKQLRFFTPEGQLIPTPQEVAEQEHQRAERLAAKLQELGIDPDAVE